MGRDAEWPSTTPHEWNPNYLDPTHAEATVLERCRNWSGYSTGHFEGCLHLYKYPKVVALVSPNYLLEQRSCQMLSGCCQCLGNCLHYIKIHQCKFSNLDNSSTSSMSMSEDETRSQINSDETYLFWEGNICISSMHFYFTNNCVSIRIQYDPAYEKPAHEPSTTTGNICIFPSNFWWKRTCLWTWFVNQITAYQHVHRLSAIHSKNSVSILPEKWTLSRMPDNTQELQYSVPESTAYTLICIFQKLLQCPWKPVEALTHCLQSHQGREGPDPGSPKQFSSPCCSWRNETWTVSQSTKIHGNC